MFHWLAKISEWYFSVKNILLKRVMGESCHWAIGGYILVFVFRLAVGRYISLAVRR